MSPLRIQYLAGILGLTTLLVPVCLGAAASVPAMLGYKPAGLNAWDFWFTEENGTWHAFYLEYPDQSAMPDQSQRHSRQWIGHAVSRDLINWAEGPTALREPGKGIATGSVVRQAGRWYMMVTHQGFSLAVSDDLDHWQWHEPRQIRVGALNAEWRGTSLSFRLLADPYIYPERIDNWWYAAVNSQVIDAPRGQRGALALLRSRDLFNWEAHRIIAYPGRFERLETPQFWRHGENWYLHFGGVDDNGTAPRRNLNMIYSAASFEGPYGEQPWSEIHLSGLARWYLGKRLELPSGEVFLVHQNTGSLSRPFRLEYGADGSPRFGAWQPPSP